MVVVLASHMKVEMIVVEAFHPLMFVVVAYTFVVDLGDSSLIVVVGVAAAAAVVVVVVAAAVVVVVVAVVVAAAAVVVVVVGFVDFFVVMIEDYVDRVSKLKKMLYSNA
jgi:hypothetical protein